MHLLRIFGLGADGALRLRAWFRRLPTLSQQQAFAGDRVGRIAIPDSAISHSFCFFASAGVSGETCVAAESRGAKLVTMSGCHAARRAAERAPEARSDLLHDAASSGRAGRSSGCLFWFPARRRRPQRPRPLQPRLRLRRPIRRARLRRLRPGKPFMPTPNVGAPQPRPRRSGLRRPRAGRLPRRRRFRSRPPPRRSRRKSPRLRRRARPRSATIRRRRFSLRPSSPPPRRRSAIRLLSTRRLADRHCRGRPGNQRSGGREAEKAAHDRGLSRRRARKRPGLGREPDGGGEALPVAHGLRQTGVVSGATLKAMNVPAAVRFNELASSANRLAGLNFSFDDRYVVVNLPSTSVKAVENGRVVHRYVAIVGDPEHPSPEIAAHVQVINLNPTWTVPPRSSRRRSSPGCSAIRVLTRAKIRILDGSGQEINPKSVNWSTERAANYTLQAGFRRRQFARLDPHRHAQQPRGLYARHALQGPVRRRLPVPQPRLCQGAGRLRLRRLATGGNGRRPCRRLGQSGAGSEDQGRRALQRQPGEGRASDLGLPHRLVDGDRPAEFRDDVYGLDSVGQAQASVQIRRCDEAIASVAYWAERARVRKRTRRSPRGRTTAPPASSTPAAWPATIRAPFASGRIGRGVEPAPQFGIRSANAARRSRRKTSP